MKAVTQKVWLDDHGRELMVVNPEQNAGLPYISVRTCNAEQLAELAMAIIDCLGPHSEHVPDIQVFLQNSIRGWTNVAND